MKTVNCPAPDLLADYAIGKVSEADLIGIASHVEICSTCQSRLETLDGLSDTIIACLRQSVDEVCEADESLLDKLLAKIKSPWSESEAGSSESISGDMFPQQVGQYRLLEKLGEGGMGAVYKARHDKLKRTVAIKLLPLRRQRSQQAVNRFHREMEAVGRLDHPNIVRATDAGESDGQFFLVMELVDGKNLSALVRSRGPLGIANACEIIRQAAIGLQHAHERDLVHRDVKPSNLMLARDEIVKVLDLGLVRSLLDEDCDGEATASGQIIGSLDYMAPEQVANSREADARADVFGLGGTLYFLLTGRPPFGDRRRNTLLEKVLARVSEEITPVQQLRSDVPDQLASILDRMLAKTPSGRYSSAAEVAALLKPFCRDSDLKGLLTSNESGQPVPQTCNTPDSVARKHLKWSYSRFIPTFSGHRKACLIGFVLLPIIVATCFGIGGILKQSDSGSRNHGMTQLAQLPPHAQAMPIGWDETAATHASQVASAYLSNAAISTPVRDAMLTVVRQHPNETRWAGRSGATLFGIATKRLPKEQMRQRATPAVLELTHTLAVHELLTAKSLLDRYSATGLTDATTLRQAVVEASGDLRLSGKAGKVVHQTTAKEDFAIAYAMADEAGLAAQLLQPQELETVRAAYRNVMHRQARELMRKSNWKDALLLWQHLHKRHLVSQQLYLDAAQCFKQLNQTQDMLHVLAEAVDAFGKNATPEFFEQAGDMALAVETDQGQSLAEKAYRMASDALKDTISPDYKRSMTQP